MSRSWLSISHHSDLLLSGHRIQIYSNKPKSHNSLKNVSLPRQYLSHLHLLSYNYLEYLRNIFFPLSIFKKNRHDRQKNNESAIFRGWAFTCISWTGLHGDRRSCSRRENDPMLTLHNARMNQE